VLLWARPLRSSCFVVLVSAGLGSPLVYTAAVRNRLLLQLVSSRTSWWRVLRVKLVLSRFGHVSLVYLVIRCGPVCIELPSLKVFSSSGSLRHRVCGGPASRPRCVSEGPCAVSSFAGRACVPQDIFPLWLPRRFVICTFRW